MSRDTFDKIAALLTAFEINTYMPVYRERSAPVFKHDQPRTLRQYFVQLDRLFAQCTITTNLEKKDFATSFLNADIAEFWEALPEFISTTTTYLQFRYRVLDLYNQITNRYTIHDLERLVSDHVQSGIRSPQDLSAFHLRYNAISMFLIEQGFLSSREQTQHYLRAFDAAHQSQIELRLQIKYPQHPPSTPYPIDAIFDAAQWILRVPATPRTFPTLSTPTAALLPISSLSSDSAFVKTAQIDAILSTTSHIVAAAVSQPDTVQKRTEHRVSPIVPVSATSARIVASISTSAASIASSPTRTTVASVPLSTTLPIEPALYTTSVPASASRPTETETAAAQEHVQALEEEIRQICTANRYYDDKYTYPRYIMPTIQAPATLPISNRPPSTFDSVPLSAPRSASILPLPLTSYMSPSPVASSRSPAIVSISPPSKPAVAAAVVKAYHPVVPVPPHSRVVIDTPSSIVAPERIRYRAPPVASIAIATSSSKSSSSNFTPVVLTYTVAAIVASPIVTIVTSSPIVPPIVTIASPIVMSPITTIVAPVVKPIVSNIAVPLVAPPIVASSTVTIVASPIEIGR